MKRLLIGDNREKLLSTLEVILKHWGYRVLVTSRPEQLEALIAESPPHLLIVGTCLLREDRSALREKIIGQVRDRGCPLIILRDTGSPVSVGVEHEALEVPLDIFALFALIQRHVEKVPRQNLRLALRLPGMLCRDGACQLTEVMSLSRQGLFIKTGFRLEKGDELRVLFPLVGMKKELEVDGRVLYRIQPDPENNYLQGVGIAFTHLNAENREALEAFIESRFLREISERERDLPGLSADQLRSRFELSLRLI